MLKNNKRITEKNQEYSPKRQTTPLLLGSMALIGNITTETLCCTIWKRNKIKYSLLEENKYLSFPPTLNGSMGLPTLFLLFLLKPMGGERNAEEGILFLSIIPTHQKHVYGLLSVIYK